MLTRVTFEHNRLGRLEDVKPLELEAETIAEVQEKILAYARQRLISKTIWLDADAFGGDIWAGMRRVAHFTIELAEEAQT